MNVLRGVCIAALALMAFVSPAAAQTQASLDDNTPWEISTGTGGDAFGLDVQVSTISPFEFVPDLPTAVDLYSASHGYRYIGTTLAQSYLKAGVGAGTDLPLGAVIGMVCAQLYDSSDTGNIRVSMGRSEQPLEPTGTPYSEYITSSAGTTASWDQGYIRACASAGTPVQSYGDLDSNGADGVISYILTIYVSGTGDTLRFGAISIYWNRQISPAPVTATFADVPVGSFGFQHIEALAASGITAGCGGGNFCPDAPLTRAQMAVFLAKSLGLHFAE